jgi:hypothetical protein
MKKSLSVLLVVLALVMSSSLVMAGEAKLLGSFYSEKYTISVYGVDMSDQPFSINDHAMGYLDVIVENTLGRQMTVHDIANAVDSIHFSAPIGKWSGHRVTKLVVK